MPALPASSESPNRPYTDLQTANNRRRCERLRKSSAVKISLLPMFSETKSTRRGGYEDNNEANLRPTLPLHWKLARYDIAASVVLALSTRRLGGIYPADIPTQAHARGNDSKSASSILHSRRKQLCTDA